jgi:hypothetical protein
MAAYFFHPELATLLLAAVSTVLPDPFDPAVSFWPLWPFDLAWFGFEFAAPPGALPCGM